MKNEKRTATDRCPTATDEASVVEQYAPLVKRMAARLIRQFPPSVQLDDLIQAGMIGLLQAARRFDGERDVRFETYAGHRIRGAMLDEIRTLDEAPRSLRRKVREAKHARPADERDEPKRAAREYREMLHEARKYDFVSLDELCESDGRAEVEIWGESSSSVFDEVALAEMREALARGLATLPEQDRTVLGLFYDQGLSLGHIGQMWNVSESRVCQVRRSAERTLSARIDPIHAAAA